MFYFPCSPEHKTFLLFNWASDTLNLVQNVLKNWPPKPVYIHCIWYNCKNSTNSLQNGMSDGGDGGSYDIHCHF